MQLAYFHCSFVKELNYKRNVYGLFVPCLYIKWRNSVKGVEFNKLLCSFRAFGRQKKER